MILALKKPIILKKRYTISWHSYNLPEQWSHKNESHYISSSYSQLQPAIKLKYTFSSLVFTSSKCLQTYVSTSLSLSQNEYLASFLLSFKSNSSIYVIFLVTLVYFCIKLQDPNDIIKILFQTEINHNEKHQPPL